MGRQLLFLCILVICYSGCTKDDSPVGIIETKMIDLSLNRSWNYSWHITLRDSSGSAISDTSDIFFVRVASTTDTLGSYIGLIRLEARSVLHYRGISRIWYQYRGDSLLEVAYDGIVYTPPIFPKINEKSSLSDGKMSSPFAFSLIPQTVRMLMKSKGIADTAIFRDENRVVCIFPLSAGKKWVSFSNPFVQNREVIGNEIKKTAIGTFLCAKILTSYPDLIPNMKWYDYVALEGLVARHIEIDSILYTTEENPDGLSYGSSEEDLHFINLED